MRDRVVTDLAQLPRVSDGWTFLYTEKVRIERADYAIELRDKSSRVHVPTVLFYPGDLDGAAGLRFMGVLDAEHNYRPKIF